MNDDSSNCNAIPRYLSGRLFCLWITMDSQLKTALTRWLSCFHSSAKFNQMKDCVVKVMKYCADSLTDSTIRGIVDKSFSKFNQMKDCVVKVMKYCADSLTDSTIRGIVDKSFDSKECSEGPALIPSSSAASLPCSSSFVTEANACTRTFRQIFVADKSSSSLCT